MGGYIEHKCPICKKIFIPAPYHAYKMSGCKQTLVCSYSCMLASEKRKKYKLRDNADISDYTTDRVLITLKYNGETHTIKEWSEITGLDEKVIRNRYRWGWSDEKILTQKVRPKKRKESNNDN